MLFVVLSAEDLRLDVWIFARISSEIKKFVRILVEIKILEGIIKFSYSKLFDGFQMPFCMAYQNILVTKI